MHKERKLRQYEAPQRTFSGARNHGARTAYPEQRLQSKYIPHTLYNSMDAAGVCALGLYPGTPVPGRIGEEEV
jgi:hypothetical protein